MKYVLLVLVSILIWNSPDSRHSRQFIGDQLNNASQIITPNDHLQRPQSLW